MSEDLKDAESQIIFVDDKIEHLEAVRQIVDPRLRVIGFLGSRKYAPNAGKRCKELDVEYAMGRSPATPCSDGLRPARQPIRW
jgi:hypothetical protein